MRFSTKSRLLAGAKAALLMAALGGVYGLYTRFETLASDGSVISGTLQKSEAPDSTAKCNTLLKNIGRRFVVQAFARSCV